MIYTGEMVLPRNCVAMTDDEMTYTEGGVQAYTSGIFQCFKLTGAETKKLITYMDNGMGLAGIITAAYAWPVAAALYIAWTFDKSNIQKFNKNNSGITIKYNMIGMGVVIQDNY
jgi:hypothetical protein